MIQIDIDTNTTIIQQYMSAKEQLKHLENAIADSKEQEFNMMHLNDKIIENAFEVIQETNRIVRMLTNEEGYKRYYKKHLRKLQRKSENGEINIKEYLEL